jgi:hypothetical protein
MHAGYLGFPQCPPRGEPDTCAQRRTDARLGEAAAVTADLTRAITGRCRRMVGWIRRARPVAPHPHDYRYAGGPR